MKSVALCYVRKSLVKAGQIDPASPDIQRRQLASWCEAANLTPEWHEDAEGHQSGMRNDRHAWRSVRDRLSQPDVAALVVTAWDRAARNVRELLTVVDECNGVGVRFVSTGDNIDTRTADGRLQLTILAGVAEHYSRRVGEWRAASIDALRRERGRHYGLAPFGTERVARDGDLVLIPSTKRQPNGTDHECLIRLYRLYGAEAKGYNATAHILNAEGWRWRNRGGALGRWEADQVRRIVRLHWIYSGHVVIGQSDRDVQEIIRGSHGPLLPGDLTRAVGLRLEASVRTGPRGRPPAVNPLSGLVRCGTCGARMRLTVVRGRRGYGYPQRCAQGGKHYAAADPLEAWVRERLAALPLPVGVIAYADETAARVLDAARDGDGSAERERIDAGLDRLADLYAAGEIDRERYRRKRAELEARRPEAPAGPLPTAIPALGDAIRAAPPELLRDVARAMIARVDLTHAGPRLVLREPFGGVG